MGKRKKCLGDCSKYKHYDRFFTRHENFRGKRNGAGSHCIYSGTKGKVTTYVRRDDYPKGTNRSIQRMAKKASLD